MLFLRNKIRIVVISGAACFYFLNKESNIVLLKSCEFCF